MRYRDMKKLNLKNNIYLVARKSDNTKGKLDYYLRMQDGTERYAFTRKFSNTCYQNCKSGMPINKAIYGKKKDVAFMSLVKYLKHIMPYLTEYYEIDGEIAKTA